MQKCKKEKKKNPNQKAPHLYAYRKEVKIFRIAGFSKGNA
jgi:hypothetical protein